jgi:Ring finger domain
MPTRTHDPGRQRPARRPRALETSKLRALLSLRSASQLLGISHASVQQHTSLRSPNTASTPPPNAAPPRRGWPRMWSPGAATAPSWPYVGGLAAGRAPPPARRARGSAPPSPTGLTTGKIETLRCSREADGALEMGVVDCSVCLDAILCGEDAAVLPCAHWFHFSCAESWLLGHNSCPNCRVTV